MKSIKIPSANKRLIIIFAPNLNTVKGEELVFENENHFRHCICGDNAIFLIDQWRLEWLRYADECYALYETVPGVPSRIISNTLKHRGTTDRKLSFHNSFDTFIGSIQNQAQDN